VGALDAFDSRGEMLSEIPGLLQFKRRTCQHNQLPQTRAGLKTRPYV